MPAPGQTFPEHFMRASSRPCGFDGSLLDVFLCTKDCGEARPLYSSKPKPPACCPGVDIYTALIPQATKEHQFSDCFTHMRDFSEIQHLDQKNSHEFLAFQKSQPCRWVAAHSFHLLQCLWLQDSLPARHNPRSEWSVWHAARYLNFQEKNNQLCLVYIITEVALMRDLMRWGGDSLGIIKKS